MANDDKDLYKVAEEYVYSVYDEIDDFRDTVEGFVAGAKWDRKEFLEKAEKFLKNALYDTQDNCGYKVVASFDSLDKEEFIEEFKKAMQC